MGWPKRAPRTTAGGGTALDVCLSLVRRTIARRMGESLARPRSTRCTPRPTPAGCWRSAREIKASPGAPDITINDLVAFCTIRAVLEVPAVNAELIDGRLYQRAHVNLGFACDTPRGLVVPVVRRSEELSVAELSGRMTALATQAVEGTLRCRRHGGRHLHGEQPRRARGRVLHAGDQPAPGRHPRRGRDPLRPVRKSDGGVEFIDVIGLSATFDHQVIDGAPGARFLNVVKQKIASVKSLCSI